MSISVEKPSITLILRKIMYTNNENLLTNTVVCVRDILVCVYDGANQDDYYGYSHSTVMDHPQLWITFNRIALFRMKINNFYVGLYLSLIHISEPTRLGMISYAVFC